MSKLTIRSNNVRICRFGIGINLGFVSGFGIQE